MTSVRFLFLPGLIMAAAVSVAVTTGLGQIFTDKAPVNGADSLRDQSIEPSTKVHRPAAGTKNEARLRAEIEKFQAEQRERFRRIPDPAPAANAFGFLFEPQLNVLWIMHPSGVRIEFVTAPKVDPAGPVDDLDIIDDRPIPATSTQLVISERSIDELTFGRNLDAASAGYHLRQRLAQRINDINAICKLTPEQWRKLDLAGRGEIQRYFDRVEEMKAPLRQIHLEMIGQRFEVLADAVAAIRPAQTFLDLTKGTGPFGDSSLFGKALRKTLTADQVAEYNRRTTNHK